MRLTAESFSDLIRSLRSNPPTGVEQRKAPRVGLRARAHILLPGREQALDVGVRDIGIAGIGLLCPISLPEAATFSLCFQSDAGAAVSLPCEVRYCKRIPSGQYQVGARFKGQPLSAMPGSTAA